MSLAERIRLHNDCGSWFAAVSRKDAAYDVSTRKRALLIPRLGSGAFPSLLIFSGPPAGKQRLPPPFRGKVLAAMPLQALPQRAIENPVLPLVHAPGRSFEGQLQLVRNAKTRSE
jgi:hypothetical protein